MYLVYTVPVCPLFGGSYIQHTCILVLVFSSVFSNGKPSLITTDEMLEKVQEAGFEIAMQKELTLTKEQAAEFYKEHEGKDYFESLCNTMSKYIHV